MHRRQLTVLAAFVFFTICIYSVLHISNPKATFHSERAENARSKQSPLRNPSLNVLQDPDSTSNTFNEKASTSTSTQGSEDVENNVNAPPKGEGGPKAKPVPGTKTHPIQYLMENSRRELDDKMKRQSKDLKGAVKEYRRRYGIPPPPHFDKWFEFAKANKVQLIDEFDTIHDLMTPFWDSNPGRSGPEPRKRWATTMPSLALLSATMASRTWTAAWNGR